MEAVSPLYCNNGCGKMLYVKDSRYLCLKCGCEVGLSHNYLELLYAEGDFQTLDKNITLIR
jgi:hypothetical protein